MFKKYTTGFFFYSESRQKRNISTKVFSVGRSGLWTFYTNRWPPFNDIFFQRKKPTTFVRLLRIEIKLEEVVPVPDTSDMLMLESNVKETALWTYVPSSCSPQCISSCPEGQFLMPSHLRDLLRHASSHMNSDEEQTGSFFLLEPS